MKAPAHPPPLRFALACFGSALVFLLLGSLGLVWVGPDLAAGWFALPRVVAVVHLFTLGWITLSMLAALHHFVPVALHVRLLPERAAWLQLGSFLAGLAAFTAGQLLGNRVLAVAGAGVVAGALLFFAGALAAAALRSSPRGRTAAALAAAAGFLAVTLVLGGVLAAVQAYGWGVSNALALLSLHARVAVVGWVLLVVVAVGQRLLPMFLLTRAPAAGPATAALLLVAVSAAASLGGYSLPGGAAWLLLLPGAAGLAIFLAQAVRAFRRSAPGQVDAGLRLAGAGLAFLAITLAGVLFAATSSVGTHPKTGLLLASAALAALSLFVAGHYYRLVPFLVWSERWAGRQGALPARSPDGLYHHRLALSPLVLMPGGGGVLLLGIGRGLAPVTRVGAALFACGVAVLAWQMARVMAGRPR